MINEFSLIHAIKDKFPLHYTTFRQTDSRISREADVENLFALAKGLTHWNIMIAPGFLRVFRDVVEDLPCHVIHRRLRKSGKPTRPQLASRGLSYALRLLNYAATDYVALLRSERLTIG